MEEPGRSHRRVHSYTQGRVRRYRQSQYACRNAALIDTAELESDLPVDPPAPALAGFAQAPHRSFDPEVAGTLESKAWVAYYRRDWFAFLWSALRVSREVFGLSWKATIQCSWLVLRANQLWAPFPDNDPERSRRMMERFYRIVQRLYDEPFDPVTAAELELQWWSVHRDNQASPPALGAGPALADALARLYSHVYGLPERSVRFAAKQRAMAMRYSDQWVREGCKPDSELLDQERRALIRSYSALLQAVRNPPHQI